ncbi:MAG: rhomboid family intramembrane serine protease [Pseudomonadota bacterium]
MGKIGNLLDFRDFEHEGPAMAKGSDADSAGRESIWDIWPVLLLAAVLIAIEVVLVIGPGQLRPNGLRNQVLEYTAFWPGLLRSWVPNYPQQPWAMFITYGFVHAGSVHLLVNVITLVSLGRLILGRFTAWAFGVLYFAAMVGGAVGFALLAAGTQPMVGSSGALFGLAGAVLALEYVDRSSEDRSSWPVVRAVGFLVVLNVVLWWAMNGLLAWQTHLGGFVIGWIMALALDSERQNK